MIFYNNKIVDNKIRLVDDYKAAKYRNYLTTTTATTVTTEQQSIDNNDDYKIGDNGGHWSNGNNGGDGNKYPKIRVLIFWMQRSSSTTAEQDLNKILEKQLKIFIYSNCGIADSQKQHDGIGGQVWLEKIKHSKSNCLSTYHYRYRFIVNNYGNDDTIDIRLKFYLIRWPDCFELKSQFFYEEFARKYFHLTNIAIGFYQYGNLDSFQYISSWLKGFYKFHRQQQKQQRRSSSIIIDNIQIYLARFGHCIVENDIDLNEKNFIQDYHVRLIDCGHHHHYNHNRGSRSSSTTSIISSNSSSSSSSSIFSRTSKRSSSCSSNDDCCKNNYHHLLESFIRCLIKVNLNEYFNLQLLSVSIQAERQQQQQKQEKRKSKWKRNRTSSSSSSWILLLFIRSTNNNPNIMNDGGHTFINWMSRYFKIKLKKWWHHVF
ncbi:hypothetical protein HUG17_8681 [Dermatophagoides farinae]|uniref:Uncharacterized protein n=1 Tax=Dermatophagoides farinae TaxID=6954 RepID=A0A9D4NT33_DERFA|nr:uncharacterized protein LOC124497223 [Dermatophagoides farinae]KAH7637577.1 hypothetical protein HUG17_8681 [Dermatophagoides farinae]